VNNGAARSYVYNALGREVEWHGDGRASEDLTDLAGHYLGSVDPSTGAWTGERIPGSSIYLAWYVNGGTTFFHYNALGSSMMNTHQDGNTVSNDVLFYPWGQMWASPVNDYFQFFGNIEGWDWEIGEGVTPNRFYPNYQGRWLSPDPLGGDVSNPQSLNRYAYALNNPTTFTDPTGLFRYNYPPDDSDTVDLSGLYHLLNIGDTGFGSTGGGGGCGSTLTVLPLPGQEKWQKCQEALAQAGKNASALDRLSTYWPTVQEAAANNGVDPAILGAIAIRETGAQNIAETHYGPYERGMGIFQIDFRYHPDAAGIAYDPSAAASYVAGMLSTSFLGYFHKGFSPPMALGAALHSYNAGAFGALPPSLANFDRGTTGGNYVSNVAAIAAYCFP